MQIISISMPLVTAQEGHCEHLPVFLKAEHSVIDRHRSPLIPRPVDGEHGNAKNRTWHWRGRGHMVRAHDHQRVRH